MWRSSRSSRWTSRRRSSDAWRSAAARRTLAALDFTTMVTVAKTREEWTVPGPAVVAFDTVTGAGRFVEFEFEGAAENAEDAIARLQEFIDSLGVDLGARINRGYPHMLLGRDR